MRQRAIRTATAWGLLALVALCAPPLAAINLNPDMDELSQEAYAQYNRWITSRDVEKRRMAADGLGGHADQPGAVALLAAALPDQDPDVRRLAAHSLWQLSDDDVDIAAAQTALRARLDDPSPAVRVNAAGALEASGVAAADLVATRRSVLQDGDWFDIALAARDLIDSVDGTELVAPLLRAMRETPGSDNDDRFDAADVLQPLVKAHGARVAPGLMRAVDDPELDRVALLEALGLVEPAPVDWQATLLRLSRDRQSDVRVASVVLLRKQVVSTQAGPDWIEPSLSLLQDPHADVRREAAELFGAAAGDGHPAADRLIALLRDDDAGVRRAAIRALGRIGDQAEAYDRAIKSGIASRARPPLEAITADAAQDKDTRDAATHALLALTAGTETHTKVLATTAPADAGALARLRSRDIAFTEDSFWRAIGERDVQTVKDLLAAGLSPSSIDANGMPPLHFALMSGCDYGQPTAAETQQIITALLAHGADPNQLETTGDNPALHRATSCDGETVKQLIAAKADIHAANASGLSSFTSFVLTSPGGAAALLDAGFRVGAKERATVQAMLQGEKDPAKRKLLTRALGTGK